MSKKDKISQPGDSDFNLDDYPLYNLNRTSATYVDEMTSTLRHVNVELPSWRILMLLDDQNPSTVSDLSRRAVIKLSTVTRMVMRMEERGLVTRTPLAEDNRATSVGITKKGRALLEDMNGVAAKVYAQAFDGIVQDKIKDFVETLKAIRTNLSTPPYLKK